jgi:excisionase family DNA binding protein
VVTVPDDRVVISKREYDGLRLAAARAGRLPPGLLRVSEVSRYMRVSPESVRRLVKAGRLEGVRAGRSLLIWAWSLRELMDSPAYDRRPVEGEERQADSQGAG